jgi:hypothetical protein
VVGEKEMEVVDGGGINEGALVEKISRLGSKEKERVASSSEFLDEAVLQLFLERQLVEVGRRFGFGKFVR